LEETDVIELASKNISDLIGFARTGDELVRGSFILNYLQRVLTFNHNEKLLSSNVYLF